jgi:hypothetical protein
MFCFQLHNKSTAIGTPIQVLKLIQIQLKIRRDISKVQLTPRPRGQRRKVLPRHFQAFSNSLSLKPPADDSAPPD